MSNLLPCPFCGGEPYRLGLTIICNCGIRKSTTPEAGVRDRVVIEWNRRFIQPTKVCSICGKLDRYCAVSDCVGEGNV